MLKVYGWDVCPHTRDAVAWLKTHNIPFEYLEIEEQPQEVIQKVVDERLRITYRDFHSFCFTSVDNVRWNVVRRGIVANVAVGIIDMSFRVIVFRHIRTLSAVHLMCPVRSFFQCNIIDNFVFYAFLQICQRQFDKFHHHKLLR